jgi:hypothetical protein
VERWCSLRLALALFSLLLQQSPTVPNRTGAFGGGGGGSAPTFVREVDTKVVGGTTSTATFSSNVSAGDTIICSVLWGGNTVTVSTFKDGTGANLTVVDTVQDTLNGGFHATYRLFNSTGGASASAITVTLSAASTTDLSLMCQEATAATTVGAHTGQQQQFPGTGTNAVTSTSVTTSSKSYCAGFTGDVGGGSPGLSAGTTVAWTSHANPGQGYMLNESFSQSSAGSIDASFTASGGGGVVLVTDIVCVN